jgi:hypothetical protein
LAKKADNLTKGGRTDGGQTYKKEDMFAEKRTSGKPTWKSLRVTSASD